MADEHERHHGEEVASIERSTYHGHEIEVRRVRARSENERGAAVALLIDGKPISIQRTEMGYLSHDSMFKVYASPYELVEDLVRQFGDAPVRPAQHAAHRPRKKPTPGHHKGK